MIIAGMLVMGSVGLLLLAVKAMSKSESFMTYARFFYASFLKPHTGDSASTGQQVALESFYRAQVREIIEQLLSAEVAITILRPICLTE